MTFTTDPNDPRLGRGVDEQPVKMNDAYLILPDTGDYLRPVRDSYVHAKELGGCGTMTKMARELAETYARSPHFYGATYCVGCKKHRPVGENGEFYWDGTQEKVGT